MWLSRFSPNLEGLSCLSENTGRVSQVVKSDFGESGGRYLEREAGGWLGSPATHTSSRT